MRMRIDECLIELLVGDLTTLSVDAIVNAANSQLAGGGGVDGAIHRAGGPSIYEETQERYPLGCPVGDAVVTGAGRLRAKHLIHAVGPIWRGGQRGEPELLQRVYRKCLDLAVQHHCQTIAFPAISTGAYGYPLDLAAELSLRTTAEYLRAVQRPAHVLFVLFGEGTWGAYARVLESFNTAASELAADVSPAIDSPWGSA